MSNYRYTVDSGGQLVIKILVGEPQKPPDNNKKNKTYTVAALINVSE